MKRLTILAAFGFTLACATPRAPQELVEARDAYAQASASASATAPTELRAARQALDDAEAAFQESPQAPAVRDRAYIALRKAELATAKARTYLEAQRLDASNARLRNLSASAAEQLRATKRELEENRARASEEQNSLRDIEQRAAALQSQLDSSQSALTSKADELESAQQKLEDEREARREAESKLTTMLQGMNDLQSVREESRGLVITLSGQVLFPSAQWSLLPAARTALDNVAEALKSQPNRMITVEGYTDSQGSPASNLVLSQARAEAVRRYLVSRGVDDDHIRATGMGEESPVAPNTTAEGRANNRRVEIVLAPAKEEAR